ncbi:MAG: aspartate kinase [Gemmatimonadota bacterium]
MHKFGGTSVGSGERILAAARLVRGAGGAPVVVVSAMSGITTLLERFAAGSPADAPGEALREMQERHLEAHRIIRRGPDAGQTASRLHEIIQQLEGRVRGGIEDSSQPGRNDARRDAVMAAGEDLSALLVTEALRTLGSDAVQVDARELIRTDARFGRAAPDTETCVRLIRDRLVPVLRRGVVPVIQGFIGADAEGRTTTLGRGGSDFTAAIIGAALGAGEVTIWTDVDGIFTADPRRIPKARILAEIGFEEAVELAWFGAKVIHPAAAKHAAARRVRLWIRNASHPERGGTLIHPDRRRAPGVAAVAHRSGTVLIRVRSRPLFMTYGFLSRIFHILSDHEISVDLVATSHTSTALTVGRGQELDGVRRALEEFAEVEITEGLTTVSLIGSGLLELPGINGEIFRALGPTHVELISQATDTALSLVVADEDAHAVEERLHAALIEQAPGVGGEGDG